MKKIIYTILLLIATTSPILAATTYNCADPNTTIHYNNTNGYPPPAPQTGDYKCGYDTSTPTGSYACSYYYNNKAVANQAGYTISNCQHAAPAGAPINSGLIILIVCGAGVFTTAIYKKQQTQLI